MESFYLSPLFESLLAVDYQQSRQVTRRTVDCLHHWPLFTMAPKKKDTTSAPDDCKLEELINTAGEQHHRQPVQIQRRTNSETPGLTIARTKTPKEKAQLKNFQALLRRKLQKFELERAIGGRQRRAAASSAASKSFVLFD
jgi:hypothetical protein